MCVSARAHLPLTLWRGQQNALGGGIQACLSARACAPNTPTHTHTHTRADARSHMHRSPEQHHVDAAAPNNPWPGLRPGTPDLPVCVVRYDRRRRSRTCPVRWQYCARNPGGKPHDTQPPLLCLHEHAHTCWPICVGLPGARLGTGRDKKHQNRGLNMIWNTHGVEGARRGGPSSTARARAPSRRTDHWPTNVQAIVGDRRGPAMMLGAGTAAGRIPPDRRGPRGRVRGRGTSQMRG